MQKVSCPSCGGEVVFRSAASVMTVCEYCRSTLLKDADAVKDIGKVAEALEDYSPFQINTSGSFQNRSFTVVGRIQLRYDAGFWNEWHILFDDGASGWLSDASGQYVVTLPNTKPSGPVPPFDEIRPGFRYPYDGAGFVASDVRTARCVAWEGELPFRVDRGWEARVADCRAGYRFLTLDYSDSDVPQIFAGQAVTLEALRCQLLRDADTIAGAAGRYKGKTTALDCPSCGSPIQYKAGMAFHVVCPACHAQVDCAADKALVLQKAEELAIIQSTLALGDMGTIDGTRFEVIGLLQCQAGNQDERSTWCEYLLFDVQRGFLWLVESELGWERVSVLNEWPTQKQPEVAVLNGEEYDIDEEYDAEVRYAAGAFNWRVSIGDRTHIRDFAKGKRKLSAESNDKEIVWTTSMGVDAQQVSQWFGKPIVGAASKDADTGAKSMSYTAAIVYSVLLAIFNLPISIATGRHGLYVIFWGLVILWVPMLIIRHLARER